MLKRRCTFDDKIILMNAITEISTELTAKRKNKKIKKEYEDY